MANAIYVLEFVLATGLIGLVIGLISVFIREEEELYRKAKFEAERNYDRVLCEFILNGKKDNAKELVFHLGDQFYQFEYPDYTPTPYVGGLYGSEGISGSMEYIDYKKIRIDLIERDIAQAQKQLIELKSRQGVSKESSSRKKAA